ncbi:hypothetical protein [Paenibacillus sp. FSL K6-1230]|uniref:hypothetical protein n=1 Tax=Paenibacillus sp. FSL K6-1230 TaxID=2921603 RepID=UPI0003A8CE02
MHIGEAIHVVPACMASMYAQYVAKYSDGQASFTPDTTRSHLAMSFVSCIQVTSI